MKRIEDRLRETIGLDAATVGRGLIQRAVRQRMRSLGLRRAEDYRQYVERSRVEWHELVESVVVTETWFFRDPEPVTALVGLVLEKGLAAPTAAPWRLLSVPCSSGEEPFSLAMALLDAGVPADRFKIEAVDVSARALARAGRGLYGRNSFRGKDLAFRDRYFRPSAEGFVLNPAVRRCVRFYQGNFLSDAFPTDHADYDFIFCRNLLIYLDPLVRQKALDKIKRLLVPGGLLFVSPAEQPLVIQGGFLRSGISTAFFCCKAAHGARQRPPGSPTVASAAVPPDHFRRTSRLQGAANLLLPAPPELCRSGQTNLETVRRLAEAGRFEEAAECCEAYLRESWTSAEAHYLLGLVRDAAGKPGAMDCYRKALYLDPRHHESLLQMALLLQNNGETARALAFKSRALRAAVKP